MLFGSGAQGGFRRRLHLPGLGIGLSVSSCFGHFCDPSSGTWSWQKQAVPRARPLWPGAGFWDGIAEGTWRVVRGGGWGEAQGSCKGSGKASFPYSRVLALLGTQMVVVNSSSPVAACSGPWDTRGMEESVTTSSGNAESLYMQGTGQEAGLGHPLPTARPTPAAGAG